MSQFPGKTAKTNTQSGDHMVVMNVRTLKERKEDRDSLDVESQESFSDISVVVVQKCLCPRVKYILDIPGH